MGFACTLGGWTPQLDELLAEDRLGRPAARVLLLDNRGVGRSSIPQRRSAYSTTAMAQDALAIMVGLVIWHPVVLCMQRLLTTYPGCRTTSAGAGHTSAGTAWGA